MCKNIAFDQYQRYKTIQLIVDKIKDCCEGEHLNILEIGANEHKNLEKFLPEANIRYSDMSLPESLIDDPQYFIADATNLKDISDDSYDIVIALDVFEHISKEKRQSFVSEISRVSKYAAIFCFPFAAPHVMRAESRANEYFKAISGQDHIWLVEHIKYGLPNLQETEEYIKTTGLPYYNFEHGDTALWEILMCSHLYTVFVPQIVPYKAEIDAYYNENLYYKDKSDNNYRAFFILGKNQDIVNQTRHVSDVFAGCITPEELNFVKQGIENIRDISELHIKRRLDAFEIAKQSRYTKFEASLYFDDGFGFSSEKRLIKPYDLDIIMRGFFEEFNIPLNTRTVRFDPLEGCGCIVQNLQVISNVGKLKYKNLNGYQVSEYHVFVTTDPQFLIDFEEHPVLWLKIKADICPIDNLPMIGLLSDFFSMIQKVDEAEIKHQEKISALNAQRDLLVIQHKEIIALKEQENQEIILSERQNHQEELKMQNQEFTKQLQILQRELSIIKQKDIENTKALDFYNIHYSAAIDGRDKYQNQYNAIKNSTSWKLTKPLRCIANVLKKILKSNRGTMLIYKGMSSIKNNGIKLTFNKTKNYILIRKYSKKRPSLLTGSNNLSAKLVKTAKSDYLTQISSIPFEGDNNSEYVKKANNSFSLEPRHIKCIAFYLPQFHPFPENNEWWGEGFTEWTNVTKSIPMFTGHYQPRLAGELGYYDLRLKETIKAQMDIAKFYGIYGFCIYYYWFDGKTLMETPLRLIIENQELDLPFCLCWANENWTRKWDGKESEILIEQKYEDGFAEHFISDISVYIKDSRYIKMNGKPVLIIYNPTSIPDLKYTLACWRKYCTDNGLGEICILAVDFMLSQSSKSAGFDGFVEFPPHSLYHDNLKIINNSIDVVHSDFNGTVYDYKDIVRRKDYLKTTTEKLYKGIFLGWDNTARRRNTATVFHNFSLDSFGEWFSDLCKYTIQNFSQNDRYIFFNAWNEWGEGTYLEPDRHYGYGALECVRNVLENSINAGRDRRIIYVSHDTCFNGAQMLSLNIIRQLHEVFNYDVYVIVKSGGELSNKFRTYAKKMLCIADDISSEKELISWVEETGAKKAMCNTVVTGDILKTLSECGISCISMIHEMEKVIHQYSCEDNLHQIIIGAKKIVFASDYVRRSVNKVEYIPNEKIDIYPQGMYTPNHSHDDRDKMRLNLRRRYQLPDTSNIVLNVAFGDYRKGIDLFARCAANVCSEANDYVFIWVGNVEPKMRDLVWEIIRGTPAENKLIYAGSQNDIISYYMAADIFLLTSREDPFPSVVLEAMNACLPVVAFEGGGGYVEIVNEQTGMLVPMEDTDEMSTMVSQLLYNNDLRLKMGNAAHELVKEKFNFIDYIYHLLSLLDEEYRKISVIIPNYNYARYLKNRIDSVLKQTYPVYEVILLDDASTDKSLEIMEAYRCDHPLRIMNIMNEKNSGNVFSQWEKGLSQAKGDYVWIAEADDNSDPLFLESLMTTMTADDKIVIGYTQSKMIDAQDVVLSDDYLCYTNDIDSEIWKANYISEASEEIIKRLSVKNTIPNVSAVVFKNRNFSAILEHAGQYNVAGDWRFYIDVLKDGGKIFFCAKNLNYHRRHSRSVTSALESEKHFEEICNCQQYIADLYLGGNLPIAAEHYRKSVKLYLLGENN